MPCLFINTALTLALYNTPLPGGPVQEPGCDTQCYPSCCVCLCACFCFVFPRR